MPSPRERNMVRIGPFCYDFFMQKNRLLNIFLSLVAFGMIILPHAEASVSMKNTENVLENIACFDKGPNLHPLPDPPDESEQT
jgi:hypothetical protein